MIFSELIAQQYMLTTQKSFPIIVKISQFQGKLNLIYSLKWLINASTIRCDAKPSPYGLDACDIAS